MLLHFLVQNRHPILVISILYVFNSLTESALVNIYRCHLCIRKALRHHQSYQSRTRTNVQHAVAPISPCSQQHAIGAHLHGAQVLSYRKAFELKHAAKVQNISEK